MSSWSCHGDCNLSLPSCRVPSVFLQRGKQEVCAGWMDYGNVPEARCMMGMEMNVWRLVGLEMRQIMEI